MSLDNDNHVETVVQLSLKTDTPRIEVMMKPNEECGLGKERAGNNWAKNEDVKVPKCPPEKEAAIMNAFRHFNLI